MKQKTCCFTGHRKLPNQKMDKILIRLNKEIENLINQGITDFISGGALGFDQIAASLIVAKKDMGKNIRLILALPCHNQDAHWTSKQRSVYKNLLNEADEIRYISEEYSLNCMKKRNYYMIDNCNLCICAFLNERSGTGQTIRYAYKKGVNIINVVE